MWNKASQRDKERAIRTLSELRLAQSKDYQKAGSRMSHATAEAHQGFTKALQAAHVQHSKDLSSIDLRLSQVESLASTILNNGANLDTKLSNGERRKQVEKSRRMLDEMLDKVERDRVLARKQAECEHEWVATDTLSDQDKHITVLEGQCALCSKPLAVPSDDSIALQKEINDPAETEAE